MFKLQKNFERTQRALIFMHRTIPLQTDSPAEGNWSVQSANWRQGTAELPVNNAAHLNK